MNWRRPRSPRYETVQWADSMGMMSWMSCIGSERNRSIGGQQPPPRATSPMMMMIDDSDKTKERGGQYRSQFKSTIGLRDRHVLPSSSSSFSLYIIFFSLLIRFFLLIRLIDFIFYFYLAPKLTIFYYLNYLNKKIDKFFK